MGEGMKRAFAAARKSRGPKLCSPSKVAKYRGLRAPACNAGAGCVRCQLKYDSSDARRARRNRVEDRIFGRG